MTRITSTIKKMAGLTLGDLLREASHAVRVGSALDYRMPSGRALPVYSLACWLTERCNLHCSMCWIRPPTRGEQPPSVWINLIEQVSRWRPRVTITGGEPSLYKGLIPILSALRAKKLYVSLNTNGLGRDRLAYELVRLSVNDVAVSLDGMADYHDRVRCRRGAWNQTTRWLKLLLAARAKRSRPKVRVVSVIGPDNLTQLPELSKQLIAWGVDCHTLQHRWFITDQMLALHQLSMRKRLGCDSPDLDGFLIRRHDAAVKIDGLMTKIKHMGLEEKVVFGPPLTPNELRTYYDEPHQSLRPFCHSRWHRITVLPNGDVTPCLSYIAGNIQRASFGQIWNGPAMRRFRSELKRGGTWPGCLRCCGLFSDQPRR